MSALNSNEARLERLLSEPLEAARQREEGALEEKIGGLDRDFILFGAGNLGRRALTKLRQMGRQPLAYMDNNPALWGTKVLDVPVMSPADAAKRFDPAQVGVITTIWSGEATDRMIDRIGPLRQLGFSRIALFGHLAWRFPETFLPHYSLDLPSKVIAQADRVRAAFELISDDASRQLFVNHIEWRLFLDFDLLPPPATELIYFDNAFSSASPAEVLYDIGAYTGDSAEDFLGTERGRAFSQVHSFEPTAASFARLQAYVASLDPALRSKVFAHQLALGDQPGTIQVESDHGPAARVGRGEETVTVSTIDEFGKRFAPPTFIKIDIEGFEPNCLAGARNTISSNAPVVAVCVYHLQSHLWDIPLQLHDYYPEYSYGYGPHLADGWDLVLYAVPRNRLPA
jgi:FkbM family methyltransferase